MASILLVVSILVAALAGTGSVVYAADGAVPGDALYGLDQAVETARLRLTRSPAARVDLLLSFAEERLAEAEALPEDAALQDVALGNYGAVVALMARGLGGVPQAAEAGVIARLQESLAEQEARMLRVQAQSRSVPRGEGANDPAGTSCVSADPHPVAEKLAETYDVSYDQIMEWFCDGGYGFGQITLALETSIVTGTPPGDLLAMWEELGGWGKVWQENGIHGRPKDRPVGPPEDKPGRGPDESGPPEDKPGQGPPDDKQKGKPDDRPVGPPEDKPGQGPPDDKQKGKPGDRPVGPPDDVPGQGPPDDAQQGPSDDAQQGPSDDAQQGPSDDAQQGPSDDAQQGPSDDAQQGPSDDAQQGPSDDAQQGPSDDAQQGPSDNAQQGPSGGGQQGPSGGNS